MSVFFSSFIIFGSKRERPSTTPSGNFQPTVHRVRVADGLNHHGRRFGNAVNLHSWPYAPYRSGCNDALPVDGNRFGAGGSHFIDDGLNILVMNIVRRQGVLRLKRRRLAAVGQCDLNSGANRFRESREKLCFLQIFVQSGGSVGTFGEFVLQFGNFLFVDFNLRFVFRGRFGCFFRRLRIGSSIIEAGAVGADAVAGQIIGGVPCGGEAQSQNEADAGNLPYKRPVTYIG